MAGGKPGRFKLLRKFQKLLAGHLSVRPSPAPRRGPARLFTGNHYFSLLFFGALGPVPPTLRGLCGASCFPRVAREVCGRPVSLGSFSEAQQTFDPEVLMDVFRELAAGHPAALEDGLLDGGRNLQLVDSTLLALPVRVAWARWRTQGKVQRAARLHLAFHAVDELPADLRVTRGASCERAAFREMAEPGATYVGDRYYGEDYGLFTELDEMGCGFVLRLRKQANPRVLQEFGLTDEDRAEGVISDSLVMLGTRERCRSGPWRRVVVRPADGGEDIILVTNQAEPKAAPAAVLARTYKARWRIELFFRWLKHTLKLGHFVLESEAGVRAVIYTAMVAALMLAVETASPPFKRVYEAIQYHLAGLARPCDVRAAAAREKASREKKKALEAGKRACAKKRAA